MRTMLIPAAAVFAALSMPILSAAWQDPLTVSPESYRLEFENAWVKVVRVIYAPHAVIPPHFHTEHASAYVYLNDGGPILFKHEGLPYAGVTRPATKAGSYRLYKGLPEVHSVENPTAARNEFLRVEFLTEPLEDASLKGKFFRDDAAPATTAAQLQFENAQVRITRVRVLGAAALRLTAEAEPMLLVALTPAGAAAGAGARRLDPGQTLWVDRGLTSTLRGVAPWSEVLRFDLKTRPLRHAEARPGQEQ